MDPDKFVFARAVPQPDPDESVFARAAGAPADSLDVVATVGQPADDPEFDGETFRALSHPPDPVASNQPDPTIYRDWGAKDRQSFYQWHDPETDRTFSIHYTVMGNKGIPMLFLHGVPTNRRQWYPVQRLCAPFFQTISIDMLGMGESDKPMDYATASDNFERWKWVHDVPYVEALMQHLYRGRKFIFVADDWGAASSVVPLLPSHARACAGGGILAKYAERYSDRLLAQIYLDPIAFDGYPVAEIQAIGRAARLPDDQFRAGMFAFDQTLVQILKTMTYDMNKWNQYTLRAIKETYVDVEYHRTWGSEPASSETMRLKFDNIRVLAQRSAILSPALLLPYDRVRNPEGVHYSAMTVPYTLVLWGAQDNMMPAEQIHRFANAIPNSSVHVRKIDRAGHFAGVDRPKCVAESIINFVRAEYGVGALTDIFLGYGGIWKGDEHAVIRDLRRQWDPQGRVHNPGGGSHVYAKLGMPIGQELTDDDVKAILLAYGISGLRYPGVRRQFAQIVVRRDGIDKVRARVREFFRQQRTIGQEREPPTNHLGPATDRRFSDRDVVAILTSFRFRNWERLSREQRRRVVGGLITVFGLDEVRRRLRRIGSHVPDYSQLDLLKAFGYTQEAIAEMPAAERDRAQAQIEQAQATEIPGRLRRHQGGPGKDLYCSAAVGELLRGGDDDDLLHPDKVEVPKFVLRLYRKSWLDRRKKNLKKKLAKAKSPTRRKKLVREIEKVDEVLNARAGKKVGDPIGQETNWLTDMEDVLGYEMLWDTPVGDYPMVKDALEVSGYSATEVESMSSLERVNHFRVLLRAGMWPEIKRKLLARRSQPRSGLLRATISHQIAAAAEPIGQRNWQVYPRFTPMPQRVYRSRVGLRAQDLINPPLRGGRPFEILMWRHTRIMIDRMIARKQRNNRAMDTATVRMLRNVAGWREELESREVPTKDVKLLQETLLKHLKFESAMVDAYILHTPGSAVHRENLGKNRITFLNQLFPYLKSPDEVVVKVKQKEGRPRKGLSALWSLHISCMAEYAQMLGRVDSYSKSSGAFQKPAAVCLALASEFGAYLDLRFKTASVVGHKIATVGDGRSSRWDLWDQFRVLPALRYRTRRDPEPAPGGDNFEAIMWEHVDLTILYVEAAWRPKSPVMQEAAVNALISQFDRWVALLDRRGLAGEDFRPILLEHTVAAKKLADAYLAQEDPAPAWKELRVNASRILGFFWRPLRLAKKMDEQQWNDLEDLWFRHLQCTRAYMRLVAETNSRSVKFEQAQRFCLAEGMEMGGLLDRVTTHGGGGGSHRSYATAAIETRLAKAVVVAGLTKPKSLASSFWDLGHGFLSMPPHRFRSDDNPQAEPQPKGSFENLAWNLTDLEIIYVEAVSRAGGSPDIPDAVRKDLVSHVALWIPALEAAGLSALEWIRLGGEHVVDHMALTDAIFADDRDAKRAAWGKMKANSQDILRFLEPLKSRARSAEQWRQVAVLWNMHVKSSKLFIKLSHRKGNRASQYEYAQRVALAYSAEMGGLLDRVTAAT